MSRLAVASARAEAIRPFYVMEIMGRAERRPKDAPPVVSMVVGEPDFPAPGPVVQAAAEALAEGRIHYTSAIGLVALREAIAHDYLDRDAIHVSPGRVAVTAGASAGLLLALAAVINPGDEVLITDPGYPCNRQFVLALGGVPKTLQVRPENQFQPTAEEVAKAWGPKTRALLLASPANPTGCMVSEVEAQKIFQVIEDRAGWLIADEIYLRLVFAGHRRSLLFLSENVISVNSFSKTYSMTGWRLGWLVVPDRLMPAIERLSQNLFISPSTLSQKAAIAAFLPESRRVADDYRARYVAQAQYLLPALQGLGFRLPAQPEGAFYGFFDVSAVTDDSYALCEALCDEAGVLMAPGKDFTEVDAHRYLRVSFPKPLVQLQEGVARLTAFFS